ncbi:hypothetical protein K440DRAFT_657396, partial [Wilcoxina mikolae CBS 423.85]
MTLVNLPADIYLCINDYLAMPAIICTTLAFLGSNPVFNIYLGTILKDRAATRLLLVACIRLKISLALFRVVLDLILEVAVVLEPQPFEALVWKDDRRDWVSMYNCDEYITSSVIEAPELGGSHATGWIEWHKP